MSELDARGSATRGRSSTRARGGRRGGFGSRGKPNGTNDASQVDELLEDNGELGEMRKQYASELGMLKDVFPDWKDVDLLFALQEAGGDVENTVDHITQGSVSQFAEVKSTKDRARSRAKEDPKAAPSEKTASSRGRGRGNHESTRGGRGRGERGRGVRGRGGHATANGARDGAEVSVPTTESSAWDTATAKSGAADSAWEDPPAESIKTGQNDDTQSAWANVVTSEEVPTAASEGTKSSVIPEGAAKKTWASMFQQPKPAPVPKKSAQHPSQQPPPAELVAQGEVPPAKESAKQQSEPTLSVPAIEEPATADVPTAVSYGDATELDQPQLDGVKPEPLTEENVEALPDESHPPATATVASTAGTNGPRNLTPLPGQPTPVSRPPVGGYAASAARAAGGSGRSASYQRRVQEQQEAVVMPGHNAVDRAAVQFGSMGLNGEPGLDVDEDREDPETRQAPQHSPPSQPRTALPPAPRQAPDQVMPESYPTPKQAPGLPPASQQNQQQVQNAMNQALGHEQSQINQAYGQYGGYGQAAVQQDSVSQQQKPYDAFGQQPLQNRYEQYGSQPQTSQPQASQAGFGGLSSSGYDFGSYQTADAQRNAYNSYYGGGYGPQDTRSQPHQEAGLSQQRVPSGFGTAPGESSFGSQGQQHGPSRYGDNTGSGHNTPNPPPGGQQHQQQNPPGAQTQASMQQQAPSHQQQAGYGTPGFPYGHPYYSSPYQQAYANQFGYSQQLGGYGSSYPSKQGGMYGGSHGYGMGQQSSYDQHAPSPANAGAFGQNQATSGMRSSSGMGGLSGLEDYGRSSAQGSQQPSGFGGGMNDPFARSGSGFGTQSGYGQQHIGSQDDALKPFNDSKGGPSPALGQPGRPGSATNSAQGAGQSGLPPSQSQQSGFGGGYQGFPGQGSQYGGLGGLGSHGQGQSNMGGQGGYGSYGGGGGGGFNQTYGGGYGSRAGWGQNYGGH